MIRSSFFLIAFTLALFWGGGPARADVITYVSGLSGSAESPPNASPGTGVTRVGIDVGAHTMRVQVQFSGLLGNTTASHIHAPTAVPFTGNVGVATELPSFTGFPLGVTSGTYDHTFDTSLTSTWNPAFMAANGGTPAGAEAAFASYLANGRAYLNVHTNRFPPGEIRGFPTLAVPEPSSLILLGGAVGAIALRQFRSRRQQLA
jgi:CHRD domain/PEP-CTERM motif